MGRGGVHRRGTGSARPSKRTWHACFYRPHGHAPEAAFKFDLVPPRDWLAENLASFPPLHIGRYFIYGSHVEVPQPAGAVTLNLDPGTAFGSGEHASTAGCLAVLDTLAKSRRFKRP